MELLLWIKVDFTETFRRLQRSSVVPFVIKDEQNRISTLVSCVFPERTWQRLLNSIRLLDSIVIYVVV